MAELILFNILGEQIEVLFDGEANRGLNSIDFINSKLSTGSYYYRLKTHDFSLTKKMAIVR